MAGSLVVPMTVSAKVVKAPIAVPRLDGPLFNREQTLEGGIHVHWVLPDKGLSRGIVGSRQHAGRVFFPGVPDLWLVIRLNPVPPIPVLPAEFVPPITLTWRAWVVDSIALTATPLESWEPPRGRDLAVIHTVAGVLPHAADLGHKAHGVLDEKSQGTFDPIVSGYYPACRTRLGFVDDVADLDGTGRVSYTVIGWYSLQEHDPLHAASNRRKWLQHARLAHDASAASFSERGTPVPVDGRTPAPSWTDAPISVVAGAETTRALVEQATRMALRGGGHADQQRKISAAAAAFPAPGGRGGPVHETVTSLVHDSGPKDVLCHGTVLEVPLAGSSTVGAPIESDDIRVYPSVKRAMADVAAKTGGGAEAVEYVEMLLQNLDAKKGNAAGILDLPGAAHALTFQSVPGRSHFYARIDVHPKATPDHVSVVAVSDSPFVENRPGSGHWPAMSTNTASVSSWRSLASVPPALLFEAAASTPPPSGPSTPKGPSPEMLAEWPDKVRTAFHAAAAAAAAAGTAIHPRLVYVQDDRRNARSASLGRSRSGTGTDGAGWWLDIDDTDALIELLKVTHGAVVHLPDAHNLFEQAGPRWYRPWSPQVVLHGTARSAKFGTGGRWRADGFVNTRVSGEAAAGLAVGGLPPVYAQDAIADPHRLVVTGLPPEARALFAESAMLNPAAAGVLARLASPQDATADQLESARRQFETVTRALLLQRSPETVAGHQDLFAQKILPFGELGGAEGTIVWNDPRDPVFLDVNYAQPRSSLESDWQLEEDHVECTPLTSGATVPPAGQVDVFEERTAVTATIANVLDSALISAQTLNAHGELVKANATPDGLNEDTFRKLDVVSAPLRALDDGLFGLGRRERTGALRLNRLDLVDMFGQVRPWASMPDGGPAAPDGDPAWPHWTELAPRLPFWSRLQFRLQAASDPALEASRFEPAVCGLLIPDFVEHAVEVFDGSGRALGQLTTDRARFGDPGQHLQVRFALHPWVAKAQQLPEDGNPLDAVENPTLRSLVASLMAQSYAIPASHGPQHLAETGLTAMLRVIDTVRGTLDPSVTVQDRRVRLLGEPIAVMVARLGFEASNGTPSALAHDPPPLPAAPAAPGIPLRIGDVTRPDDGVLGAFLPGATPAEGRFAPVSVEARTHAVFNGMAHGVVHDFGTGLGIVHDFIASHEVKVTVTAGQPSDVILLTDVRGGLYATCGVLPRKHLTLPREFLDAAVARMEPTFRVGPLLTFVRQGALRPVVPPPSIDGHVAEFVHETPGPAPGTTMFAETPVPPAPPVTELPLDRVTLREGWIRVFKPPS